jgi:hypothetical protein
VVSGSRNPSPSQDRPAGWCGFARRFTYVEDTGGQATAGYKDGRGPLGVAAFGHGRRPDGWSGFAERFTYVEDTGGQATAGFRWRQQHPDRGWCRVLATRAYEMGEMVASRPGLAFPGIIWYTVYQINR